MINLRVNRKDYEVDVSLETPLLWVLRETLGLTGTKFGCGIAQCGACTVHINEKRRRNGSAADCAGRDQCCLRPYG